MALDVSTHKTILFQILKEIYSDTSLSPFVGFKGGTAASLFYGLDRFSVDLDFDLLDESKAEYVFERITEIARNYGKVKDLYKKRHSLLCVLSYEDTAHNIKIEVSRRQIKSRYEVKAYLGVSMLVMEPADMFAHKLVAMYERIGKTSRDIYDVWFFSKNRFPINTELVEERTGMDFGETIEKCIAKLEKVTDRNMLKGVGELLTEQQKDWAHIKLRNETIALLQLRKE